MNGINENIDVASAEDYAATTPMTFNEYVKSVKGYDSLEGDYGVFGNLYNWYNGKRDVLEKDYNNYLQNLSAKDAAKNAQIADDKAYARELAATASAREWDKMMADTQYQRTVADLKKAGLNPWLALQSGVSGSEVPNSGKASASASAPKGSGYEYQSKNKKTSGGRDLALLLFAIARLAAA